jgi:serine-type D-Ala-D-Ala carboxypeptidase
MTGCGTKIENAYDTYSTDYINGYSGSNYFASNLCVTNDVNFGQDNMQFAKTAEGAGAFNIDTHQVLYSQNLFEKLYPASTTKILTAYIILKNCDLNATVTVSHDAANPGHSSSVCGLKEGDVITVQDLLYGLLLESGNDAAIALAEYCSGSVEEFAKLMNSTAKSFGATNSSFVNPSGLPDENHYTTIYDMYLIFSNAISLESFVAIISSQTHDVAYTNAQGAAVSKTYKNTCGYLTGAYTAPENVTVTGVKTGTTGEAGHCLVLLSQNAKNERIISIVYKADGKKDLYSFMNEILSGFAN